MTARLGVAALAGLVAFAAIASAQEVRRALPVQPEPPMGRAVPFDPPAPSPSLTPAPVPEQLAAESAPTDEARTAPNEESPAARQLDYATALFGRKLYDLAVPEFEKFVTNFPDAPGRASAFFYLGECYRSLGKTAATRSSFQTVLDQYGDSEFAGPAAYGVAEILFTQKSYEAALPLFHRAAAKTKDGGLALSARYFEARCFENLRRSDEALDAYQEVIASKRTNPYREDSRLAAGTILLADGKKAEALKQYEALGNETDKEALKAEAYVRAGLLAVDLAPNDKTKGAASMSEKAATLLRKGAALKGAGKWEGLAQVGLIRLRYQSGDYEQAVSIYQRASDEIPDTLRGEMLLLVGNSQRQLGHTEQAEKIYQQIITNYPSRDEAKEARYQRLINLYNSNSPQLAAEVQQYLASNPSDERASQARLLQAETFYKAGNFAEAAPLYSELRSAKLSPRLKSECAYKLAWCYVQLKDSAKLVEAFTYFLQAFPENSQASTALMQRALAYQENKNYDAALADLTTLLANFPKAREREAALQQKALILGQQDDAKGMAAAFRQLLKEYPKSAVAAQAHYYIGKASFDAKDYEKAIPELELARKLDKNQYYNLATLRIISSYFYLKDRQSLAHEVDDFMAANSGTKVPAEILEWLGIESYNEKSYEAAARYLTALSESENLASMKPDFWFYLGDAQSKQQNYPGAETAFEKYLAAATDPAGKAKVLLALGAVKIGAHKPEEAQKIAEEIMKLQPEGRVNAEARLLAGDVALEQQHYDDASKAFMSVALLYDDPAITPRALQKAAVAFEKAGKPDDAARVTKELHDKYPDFAGS